jgi:hypothetical protein
MSASDGLIDAIRRGVTQVLREQHDAMRETIEGLDEDALNWVPGPETNSLAILFTHTLGAEDSITATILGDQIERDRAAEFQVRISDPEELRRRIDEVEQRVLARVDRLTGAELAAQKSPPRDRLGRNYLGSWWLFHAVEHNREHIAQAGLTRQLYEQQANPNPS